MRIPATCYEPSPRKMPTKLLPLEYPDRFEVRYVSANGGIRWNRQWVNVSHVCVGAYVGLEEIDDGVWNVYFGPLKLGMRGLSAARASQGSSWSGWRSRTSRTKSWAQAIAAATSGC